VIRDCIAASSQRHFRIVQFSVQNDHLHLLVEASDKAGLSSGAQGLSIRIARQLNRHLGRTGSVWNDRYHTRALTSPREVRNALVYVLMNVKKHNPVASDGIDPCSSAPWFDGFLPEQLPTPSPDPPPLPSPRTWLAAHGWRRHGLISLRERPKMMQKMTR
jgi:putative transposase